MWLRGFMAVALSGVPAMAGYADGPGDACYEAMQMHCDGGRECMTEFMTKCGDPACGDLETGKFEGSMDALGCDVGDEVDVPACDKSSDCLAGEECIMLSADMPLTGTATCPVNETCFCAPSGGGEVDVPACDRSSDCVAGEECTKLSNEMPLEGSASCSGNETCFCAPSGDGEAPNSTRRLSFESTSNSSTFTTTPSRPDWWQPATTSGGIATCLSLLMVYQPCPKWDASMNYLTTNLMTKFQTMEVPGVCGGKGIKSGAKLCMEDGDCGKGQECDTSNFPSVCCNKDKKDKKSPSKKKDSKKPSSKKPSSKKDSKKPSAKKPSTPSKKSKTEKSKATPPTKTKTEKKTTPQKKKTEKKAPAEKKSKKESPAKSKTESPAKKKESPAKSKKESPAKKKKESPAKKKTEKTSGKKKDTSKEKGKSDGTKKKEKGSKKKKSRKLSGGLVYV